MPRRWVITYPNSSNAAYHASREQRTVKRYGRRSVVLGFDHASLVGGGTFEEDLPISAASLELEIAMQAENITAAMDSIMSEEGGLEWYFDSEYGLGAIWDRVPSITARIAVIDSGIAQAAKSLLFRSVLAGYDFVSSEAISEDGDGRDMDPTDPGGDCTGAPKWHGTQMAAAMAGDFMAVGGDVAGMHSVSANTQLQFVRVLGRCSGGYASDAADAIVWAAGGPINGVPTNPFPAKVLSLSFVGRGSCPSYLQSAVTQALELGAMLVAAAGNEALNANSFFPANCMGVVRIGGSTRSGDLAWFSNYNVERLAPAGDVMAPILTVTVDEISGQLVRGLSAGTSFSAAFGAGVACLLLPTYPEWETAVTPFAVGGRCSAWGTTPNITQRMACGKGILHVSPHHDWWNITQLTDTPNLETENASMIIRAAVTCPAGAYTTALTDTVCTACAAGKYGTQTGAVSSAACIGCLAGTYGTATGAISATVCVNCGAGTYATAGSTSCVQCAAGYYSTQSGAGLCVPCGSGTFSTVVGSTMSNNCASCPAGTYQACNLVVFDRGNHLVRLVNAETGFTSTWIGKNYYQSPGSAAFTNTVPQDGFGDNVALRTMGGPSKALSPDESFMLVLDDNAIRRIDIHTAQVTTVMGKWDVSANNRFGVGTDVRFVVPWALVVSRDGQFALCRDNTVMFYINISTMTSSPWVGGGVTTTVVDGVGTSALLSNMYSTETNYGGLNMDMSWDGSTIFFFDGGYIRKGNIATKSITTLIAYSAQVGLVVDPTNSYLLLVETMPTQPVLIALNLSTLQLTTVFNNPNNIAFNGVSNARARGMVFSRDGKRLFMITIYRILVFDVQTWSVTALTGSGNLYSSYGYTDGDASLVKFVENRGITMQCATGKTQCTACPAGKSSLNTGSTECQLVCPVGTYKSASQCLLCPSGTYSTSSYADSSSVCMGCSAGTYSTVMGASTSAVCVWCVAGTYSTAATSSCTACAAGYYSTQSGLTLCVQCSAGTYGTVVGATMTGGCLQCSAGTYATAGSSSCAQCAAGYYSTQSGARRCIPCGSGTYSNVTGSASSANCAACPAGTHQQCNLILFDANNRLVRLVNTETGFTSTWIGKNQYLVPFSAASNSTKTAEDGFGPNASTYKMGGLSKVLSADGSFLLVRDSYALRLIDMHTAQVTTVMGKVDTSGINSNIGVGTNVRFSGYMWSVISRDGQFAIVADVNVLLYVNISTMTSSLWAGSSAQTTVVDGVGTSAGLNWVFSMDMSQDGSVIYIQDDVYIRKAVVSTKQITTLITYVQKSIFVIDPTNSYLLLYNPDIVTPTLNKLDLSTNQVTTVFNNQNGFVFGPYQYSVSSMVFSSDGKRLFVVFLLNIYVFDVNTWAVKFLTGENSPQTAGYVDGDGPLVLYYYNNGVSMQCATGKTQCTACPAGKSSLVAGSTECQMVCPAGTYKSAFQCVLCPSGTYSTNSYADSSSVCVSCSAGTYSTVIGANRTASCIGCGPGTYGTATGAISAGMCVGCGAGAYGTATGANSSAACVGCDAGTYSTLASGASSCVGCAAGTYGTATGAISAGMCVGCGAGTYSTLASGASSCVRCATGTYGTATGATSAAACVRCGAGTYSSTTAATSVGVCVGCGAGTYSTGGAAQCTVCAAGTYGTDIAATSAAACVGCGAGTYSIATSTTACVSCQAGTYGTATGANACVRCGAGTYSNKLGSSSCSVCTAGSYSSSSVGSSSCSGCLAGSYSTGVGSSSCWGCAAGTYSSAVGSNSSASCTQCPPGTFGPSTGNTACMPCRVCPADISSNVGGVCDATGITADPVRCSCLPGTYGSVPLCSPCPLYTTSLFNNTASLLGCRCIQGFVCAYSKQINITVRIPNMTLALFSASYRDAFISNIALAAGVPVAQVSIVASMPMQRRLHQPLVVLFRVQGSEGLLQNCALHKEVPYEMSWVHAHQVQIKNTAR